MSDTDTTQPDLAGKAQDAIRDAKTKATEFTDDVARLAKDNVAQLGDTTREFASNAQDKIEDAVADRKSIGADYISSIARATGQAANAFETDLPLASNFMRQASDQIQGMANTVRQRDVRELVGEVQEFARKQPALFFGSAVVLGFVALRFLKSTTPKEATAFDSRREG